MEIDLGKINNIQYQKDIIYDDPVGKYMDSSQSITTTKSIKKSNIGWVCYISIRSGGSTDKSSSNLLFIPKWFNENRVGLMACSETGESNPFFVLLREENGVTNLYGRNQSSNSFVLHKIISI